MSNQRFSPEWKDEAVRQIIDRGFSIAEVSKRLGVSAHSLYKWIKAVKPDKTDEQAAALIEAQSETPARRGPRRVRVDPSSFPICESLFQGHRFQVGQIASTRSGRILTAITPHRFTAVPRSG